MKSYIIVLLALLQSLGCLCEWLFDLIKTLLNTIFFTFFYQAFKP